MREYMARRRKTGAAGDRKVADNLYRTTHREERRMAETERYSKHRRSILARPRDRRQEQKEREFEAEKDQERDDH